MKPRVNLKFDRVALVLAATLMAAPAAAAPLNPNDFGSLGLVSGADIVINTSTQDYNGNPVGTIVSPGGGLPDIAVYTFDGGSVLGNVTVTGTIPVAILFQGAGTIAGTVDVSGGMYFAGAGGANGGSHDSVGSGTGGGDFGGPGAGGSFGSLGGIAGAGTTQANPSQTYGDLTNALEGGSGGGGGASTGFPYYETGGLGGGGGGALEIGALTDLIIAETAVIHADGGLGGDGDGGRSGNPYGTWGGGGGSGGGVLIHAYDVEVLANAIITANGGNPGKFGIPGQGGCGGAGRIAILYNSAGSYSNGGTVEAIPGDDGSGADSGTNCHPTDPLNTVSVLSSPDIGGTPISPVPLPASLPLFGTALAGLEVLRRGRKSS